MEVTKRTVAVTCECGRHYPSIPVRSGVRAMRRCACKAWVYAEILTLRGYVCHCVSFMPETQVYLEGTDAGVCKQLLAQMVNDVTSERVPISEMRAFRYDKGGGQANGG